MADTNLTTIDLSTFSKFEETEDMLLLSKQIRKACENDGFFHVKPTLETQEIMNVMIDLGKRFFELPLDEKLKTNNDETTSFFLKGRSIPGTGAGYRAMGADVNFSKDTRESFNISSDNIGRYSLEDIIKFKLSGTGRNKWPTEEVLPGWRKKIESYVKCLLDLSVILRKLIVISLNLPSSYFDKPGFFDKSTWVLGFNHYFPVKSVTSDKVFGIRPHCDSGIFTMLLTDKNMGLEMCRDKTISHKEKAWMPVPPAPNGCLIVNLGKNLEYWTNYVFKATLHRVVNNTGKERFSVPFFYESNIDLVIKPLDPFSSTSFSQTTPAELLYKRLELNETEAFD